MPCYSQIRIPQSILDLKATVEEQAEVLKRMGRTAVWNYNRELANLSLAEQAQFKRELQALRAIKTAQREGYKTVKEERVGQRIVIRAYD